MTNNSYRWEILRELKNLPAQAGEKTEKLKDSDIINVLLENRGLKTKKEKEEFFNPREPEKIDIKELGISEGSLKKAIEKVKRAKEKKEKVIIYGDYDADGICATAILWECLYGLGIDVAPYIPSRFDEGYGINANSVENLKSQFPNLKLIITVDNGIVANEAVEKANKLGIDVIITDHHQKGRKLPKAHSIVHTDKISGSGIAWFLAREIAKSFQLPVSSRQSNENSKINKLENSLEIGNWKLEIRKGLELCAIGTIADQLPLFGPNRSIVKYGLEFLNKTKRPGLLALFEEAGLTGLKGRFLQGAKIGTYEVNYVIAPRLNAMGRMEHAIDSLRLLCTNNLQRARELAQFLGRTNKERQRVVEEVVLHAREIAKKKIWKGAIVLAHESYHEGVIGLAASKLVEEFYRPAIVLSKGDKFSKASARSIAGFNIIENIRKLDSIIHGGGGHPMAAGFTIETDKIEAFSQKFDEITFPLLSKELLTKRLKIDLDIKLGQITQELYYKLKQFEPYGIGNPTPTFVTGKVNIMDARTVGQGGKHLKLKIEKDGIYFDAIGFGLGYALPDLTPEKQADVVYSVEENVWNGNTSLQLKLKDLKIN